MTVKSKLHQLILHPSVKCQIIILRAILLLLTIHYQYTCWELDLAFAIYLLFVFKSNTAALAMLAVWSLCQMTHVSRGSLRMEVMALEVVLLCCLKGEGGGGRGGNQVVGGKGIEKQNGLLRGADQQSPTPTTELNKVQWQLLDRFPYELQDKPTYHFLMQQFTTNSCFGEVPQQILANYLCSISNTYNNLPYHNITHALDVAHTVYVFLKDMGMRRYLQLSDLEYGAMLLAGYGHDVGHEGLRNSYYSKIGHPLATNYYDRSILQNYHCSIVFSLSRKPSCQIFQQLPKQSFCHMKKLIINVILGTDMQFHHDNLQKLKQVVQTRVYLSQMSQTHRDIITRELLHAADINGPSKMFEKSEMWKVRIAKEFENEEKELAGLGLGGVAGKIDVLQLNAGQIKFIDAICLPLYMELRVIEGRFQEYVDSLLTNRRRYENTLREARDSGVAL